MRKILFLFLLIPNLILAQGNTSDLIAPGLLYDPAGQIGIGLQSTDNLSDKWQQNISFNYTQNYFRGDVLCLPYAQYLASKAKQTNLSLQFQKSIGKKLLVGIRVPYLFSKMTSEKYENINKQNGIGDFSLNVSGLIFEKKTKWKENIIKNRIITRINLSAPTNNFYFNEAPILSNGNNTWASSYTLLYAFSINNNKLVFANSYLIPIERNIVINLGTMFQSSIQYHYRYTIKKLEIAPNVGFTYDNLIVNSIYYSYINSGFKRVAASVGTFLKFKRYFLMLSASRDIYRNYKGQQLTRTNLFAIESGIMF